MKKTWPAILAILLIAAFFRFWDIKTVPPGLWTDEAMNGTNIIEVIGTRHWKVFYPENFGREGLFINIQSLFIMAFGAHPWALRLPSAIFGLLTVFGLYLMIKELFKKERVTLFSSERIALFAAFFLATSFWHINFSRIGLRAIMAPFFLVWSFYFLFKAIDEVNGDNGAGGKVTFLFIIAGLFLGLGAHSYIAYRVAPFIALLPLWKFYKDYRAGKTKSACAPCLIGLFIFMAFLAAFPLLWYYAHNPADFLGRTSAISIFKAPNPLGQFAINLGKTLAMFNLAGDFNWRHNLAGSAELWWPVGILFLFGIWQSIKKIRELPYFFIILWSTLMILPVVFSSEGLPHALRAIILIPPAMIFAALGLDWLITKIQNWFTEQKTIILLFVFFVAATITTFNQYFFEWAPSPDVYQAFETDLTKKAEWLNLEPKNIKKYVLTSAVDHLDMRGTPMSIQPTIFITNTFFDYQQRGRNIYYITMNDLGSVDCSARCEILPAETNPGIYKIVKQKIPGLRLDASPGFIVLKN